MKKIAYIALPVVLLVVGYFTLRDTKPEAPKPNNEVESDLVGDGETHEFDAVAGVGVVDLPRFDQTKEFIRNDPSTWSEAATRFAEEGQTEEYYLEALNEVVIGYVTAVKTGVPAGLNIEITNAMLGQNAGAIAVLEDKHPRINDAGELVDKWGTPYIFDNIALDKLGIISAGPDQQHGTDDDVSLK